MYGSPDTTPGGLGLRHAASIRIEFRKKWLKDPKDETKVVGQTVTFVTAKNKTFPPNRRGEFDIYTDGPNKGQIDSNREVFNYGVISELIEKHDKTYVIEGKKYVGKEKAAAALSENPALVEELKKKIVAHMLQKKTL